jgi:uncharacterized damage-inducible protein DinB
VSLAEHFQMLARYNRMANERIYEVCAQLCDEERRKQRAGSFGSIHALLNHLLLGDRIWMARFIAASDASRPRGAGHTTPPLNAILFENFDDLRRARTAKDAAIETFFDSLHDDVCDQSFTYVNNQGKDHVEPALVAFSHFFNHQTHHRGQIHVMLSQTEVAPPSLDLHRIINP